MIAVSVHYRPYLSLVFVSLLIAIALWRWLPPRWFRPVSISLLALLAMTSWRHNATWANGVSLFTHSVRYGGAPLAKLNLGVAFMGTDNERAAALFEEVLAGNPGYILARLNLGLTRARLGDVDAGLALIEEAVRQDPLRAQTHYWHAVALNEAGRSAEAARASASAVLLRPMELRYRYRAALDQQALEHYEKSLEHLRVVAEVDPEYRRVGFNIGFALQKLGRYDEAIETYRDFLRGNDDARAWSNLGWAYFDSGRCREAIDAFERTLRLLPGDPTAVSRIAECRRRLG
jgi:tetratricopeptide (TPR) repeat protein